MILKIRPNKNIYGKYFLAVEAPDDDETEVTDEQPKPRRNVKVVSVKPSNRGKDFTRVGIDPINADDTEVGDDGPDIDETDYSTDTSSTEIPAETTPQTDDSQTADADTTMGADENQDGTSDPATTDDESPDTGEDDTTDFTSDTDTTDTDTGGDETGEDGPDVDDTEDFTDTGDTDAASDSTPDDSSNATQPAAPGVELDSARKYNLYKEYMSLYNACDNYISKLENILRNDYEENQIIRMSVNSLREIKDILSDYMTIRFQLNTYVQSLLFYQKMVVAVQLVFKMLKSINSSNTK